ncbi:TraX family protein [Abyssisolibacter fermentans]|uniref:TraX family protein n=1 Tax=Abyssisolibacter fermentans TaxID=1766203 RepID=UPI000833260F|nr:TraX family protein [Abyssisolibacter fermentans]
MEVAKNKLTVKTQRNDLLKLFAMFTMLIDHVGVSFFPNLLIFRSIGRLALPIFAYQLAIGYSKTSNLKQYSKRLFIFALISQVPYTFLGYQYGMEICPFQLSVMFTLLLSLGVMHVYDKGIEHISCFRKEKSYKVLLLGILIFIGLCLIIIAPEILNKITDGKINFEYSFYLLLMVLLFHINHDKKILMVLSYTILSIICAYIIGVQMISRFLEKTLEFSCALKMMTKNGAFFKLDGYFFQVRSIFAFIPIFIFESFKTEFKLNKYVGYWFYPAHMAILIMISWIIK